MGLRIVLVGQAAFGEKTLERLAARHEIVAVYAPPDSPKGRVDPLAAAARSRGIPLQQPRSMKTDDVYDAFRGHDADLGVLAYVTVIVPERLIVLPRQGTICFHPSLLPRYRGGSAINWQIIRGETEGGLTVFWTDAGIDRGPILLQKPVAIGPYDTAASFYYDKIFSLGVDAMDEAVAAIADGSAPRIPQDETQASYDPLCRDEHVGIDWSRSARAVYDLVRGADPQPGAWAMLDGQRMRLYDARLEEGLDGRPGEIVGIGAAGARIALPDGILRIGRVRVGESPDKVSPDELCRAGTLMPGTVLASASPS
ncbi:MAG: methionyl-tRNA formyltransferase [Candidatus Binatota bacterium]|jgi:methionyl-tRNA formyltransferase|nr:methionyl-tRNA formyltransferase [Candidatus Binatota bacterium]